MRARNKSEIAGYQARADLESAEYVERVAQPLMQAIDGMPTEYRRLVDEFGYVDVYRAWRRRMRPDEIRSRAKDGTFSL